MMKLKKERKKERKEEKKESTKERNITRKNIDQKK